MNQSRTAVLLLSLSAVCCFSALYILCGFIFNPERNGAPSAEVISEYTASGLIDSALKAEITVPTVNFVSEISSPFRPLEPQAARSSAYKPAAVIKSPAAAAPRIPLRLKGLMMNPALVIVEDASGETHIKAQGDSVRSALIVSIGSNSAVFKDSIGTFELIVEGSR